MTTPDGGESSRWQRIGGFRRSSSYKTTTLVMSALFLVVIGVVAIATAVSTNDDTTSAQMTPTDQNPVTPQPSPPPADTLAPEAFGIPTTDQHGRRIETPTNPAGQILPQTRSSTPDSAADGAVAAPAGLMWQRVNGVVLPFSTSDGPTQLDASGVPGGFAHTPQGAVLAAWQINQRIGWAPDDQAQAVLARCAVVSPAAQAVADRAVHNDSQLIQLRPELPARLFDAPIAVKVDNYSADYAHVQIAQPNDPGVAAPIAAAVRLDVVWRDGSWKWVVPSDGVETSAPIDDLDGWTKW